MSTLRQSLIELRAKMLEVQKQLAEQSEEKALELSGAASIVEQWIEHLENDRPALEAGQWWVNRNNEVVGPLARASRRWQKPWVGIVHAGAEKVSLHYDGAGYFNGPHSPCYEDLIRLATHKERRTKRVES